MVVAVVITVISIEIGIMLYVTRFGRVGGVPIYSVIRKSRGYSFHTA